jgi:hypothetical protein
LYHAFSSFLLSTAVQYLMIPREEVELNDVTSYNIIDKPNIQDIIIKLTYSHSNSKIKKLWLTSQDTSPILNKVTRAPSDILIGQTRSANSSHGLPKYMMMHSPICSINVTWPILHSILSPLSLVHTREVPSKIIFSRKQTRNKQDGGIIFNTCCKEIWLNVIVTDWNIWYYIIKELLH